MEIQSSVLYIMVKSTSASENCNPTQRESIHHLQPQYEQRDTHPRFQQSPKQLHTQQNNEAEKHDKL